MAASQKEFFDSIADKWDGWVDKNSFNFQVNSGLDNFGIAKDEHILDAGCGTGNLTLLLLERISENGRIYSLDVSPKIIEVAKGKIKDQRVTFLVEDVENTHLEDSSMDRVFCLSMWPHVFNPEEVLQELYRILKNNGCLHIWHIESREKINNIHRTAGGAVENDVLIPAEQLASMVENAGFKLETIIDSDDKYLITARK